MIRTSIVFSAMAVLLSGMVWTEAGANTRYVDDAVKDPFECQGAPYATIGAALADSQPGDEIRVCPGVYPEQVVITKQLRFTGISIGTNRPVIKPTALPATRPSILGGNPVAAAIIVDAEFVRMDNLDVDLSQITSPAACSPALAGVYLRDASGVVERLNIHEVKVPGRPDCDSGVALYIESGQIGDELGRPIYGLARVNIRDCFFSGYQKAGLVGNGPRTILTIKDGEAIGLGATNGAVQAGYQFGLGATGKVSSIVTRAHRSSIAGKAAAGLLVYQSERVSIRKMEAYDSETGVLGVGDRLRVKKSTLSGLAGDGIVFLGDANVASGNLIEEASVSGAFVNGARNSIRGGVMRNMNLGVWFQSGFGNRYAAIRFEGVPVAGQALSGGIRADMTVAAAAPFTTACEVPLECDDGRECTADACSGTGVCSSSAVVNGTTCASGTGTCTAGNCIVP
ncbi:MAG TPA: hypothetical protein VGR62_13160 [Candidatus Binatia bacterium]|jgi:hypothetical protein|nr:hypothetical protein [Candidatus Binatia bacterium]